jgi:bifunctional DNA-binding transcriptional regulator/antitoxin component of YhaV-PrlF toxin-antitoxin module
MCLDVIAGMADHHAMITTVTGKNQITIPAKVVSTHAIRVGTRLLWEATDQPDVLKVRVLPDLATLARNMLGAGRKHPSEGAQPIEELVARQESEDDQRHKWD